MVKVKKERLIFSFLLVSTLAAQAQVGVNTVTPKSTLHVLPSTTGSATAEGIIAPNLTRAQLIAKDAKYTDTERGAIVYVTDLSGTLSAKTSKVTQAGYYFFDGSVWQQFASSMPVVSPSPWLVQGSTTEQAINNSQNIYQGGKVAIGKSSISDYNLDVAGSSNVTGNSQVGSSTVVGAQKVGTTLEVTETSTLTGKVGIGRTAPTGDYILAIAGNTHQIGDEYIRGSLKMGNVNTSPTLNTSAQLELSDTDKGFLPNRVALTNATLKTPVVNAVDGIMVYNTSTVAAQGLTPGYYFWMNNQWNRTTPAQPWLVQGSTTQASSNSQAIYQAGRVAIGTGATAVSTYTLQVAGTAYISGNSRVENSTVAGNETVSGTLAVTGATTLGNALTVGGTTNTKATNITGTLNYKPAGTAPAANTYLRTDASGNASWQALPVVATTEPWQVQGGSTLATTNSQNIYQAGRVAIGTTSTTVASAYTLDVNGTSNVSGNSKVGSSTVAGNETVGGTLGVTGATTLGNALTVGGTTNAKATNITGTLNYKPTGTAPAANTYLRTDASGNASWQALPVVATTEPWQVQGGSTLATSNSQNIYQTGSVGIGSNAGVNAAYKFQVTGASNITGNSRVGSSTVLGNEQVSENLGVSGTSNLNGKVGIGRAPAQGEYILAMTGNSFQSGNGYVSGSIKMGGDETFNTSAQLELKDGNKGFLPNRVALTNITVKSPVTNAVDGMFVYNTAAVASQGITPGYYFWMDNQWNRVINSIPAATVNMLNLQTNITITNATTNVLAGKKLPFEEITIPADGSYAFSYRLYGSIAGGSAPTRYPFYIGVVKNGKTILDAAEMDLIAIGGSSDYSYSVTLGGTFAKGDKVTTWMSRNNANWTLKSSGSSSNPVRTSMIWWKL